MRSSGGGFVPTDISGCILWLDASDDSTVLTDANGCYQWNDKSASGYNFEQSVDANKPQVASAIQNGLDGLYFNNDFMYNSSITASSLSWGVAWLTAGTTTSYFTLFDGRISGRHLVDAAGNGARDLRLYQSSSYVPFSNFIAINTPYLYVFELNGVNSYAKYNGGTKSSTGNTGASTFTGLNLGANAGEALQSNHYYLELFAHTGSYTNDDITNIETYLNNKWSIY